MGTTAQAWGYSTQDPAPASVLSGEQYDRPQVLGALKPSGRQRERVLKPWCQSDPAPAFALTYKRNQQMGELSISHSLSNEKI